MTEPSVAPVVRFGAGTTVVAFHAHPDDEALLTGGTLALAAARGARVILVTATCGGKGLAAPGDGTGATLAARRSAELDRSAAALGCSRVVKLGYDDSGLVPDPRELRAFANADVEQAAHRLATVLREEGADVLIAYDRNGGYGHPDHVQVHRVGHRAAVAAGTPLVLEATVPATLFRWLLRVMVALGLPSRDASPRGLDEVFVDRSEIGLRVDVRAHLDAKRRALAAHASQRRGPAGIRLIDVAVRLPGPLFARCFGREWYVVRQTPAAVTTASVRKPATRPSRMP